MNLGAGVAANRIAVSRWVLLAVLSCITVINFVDRQSISILYPVIERELHLPPQTYATLVTVFLVAYTPMYAIGGWIVDRIGARNGLALALAWWSGATILTACVHSVGWLVALRVILALGQAMIFPAGVKACAEFFPTQERALATGIFSAGSGVGALLATPSLAAIALHAGWRWAMTIPGFIGVFIVPVWMLVCSFTTKLPDASATTANKSWGEVFRHRSAWALVLPRIIGDPLWYFCFFWIPVYLQEVRHLDLKAMALIGWLPFLFADLGSIVGGSLSDLLIRRGYRPVRARVAVLIWSAALAPLGTLVGWAPSLWLAILLMGLMAFLSQCWTVTTAALATDIIPQSSVGAVAGMMGTAGGVGAAFCSQFTGAAVRDFGFAPTFVLAALLLPAAVPMLVFLLRASAVAASEKVGVSFS